MQFNKNRPNDVRNPHYWYIRGYSEEESIDKAKLECRKRSVRCVEYWLNKGYSEEESHNIIKKYQNNGKSHIGKKRSEETKNKISKEVRKRKDIDYWINLYGEEEGKNRYENYIDKKKKAGYSAIDKRKNRGDNFRETSIRCKEYWLKRGYSQDEASYMVSRNQSRDINFFIEKYGYKDGYQKWKDKIDKFIYSFNTNNDLDEVNKKRKINSHCGYYTENNVGFFDSLFLYLILLKDYDGTPFIKYGLTKHSNLYKRWSLSLNYEIIYFNKMKSKEAYFIEKELNKKYKKTYIPDVIKTTESLLYTDKNLKDCLSIIEGEYNA